MREAPARGRVRPGESGSVIVEMALLMPLLLLLLFGLFEFGRAWLITNTLNHASREAVRLAVVTPNLAADNAAVINRATTILANAGIVGAAVTHTAPAGTPPLVTITTTWNFAYLTGFGPFFGFSFAGTIPLTASATMRYER